jgi:hypothetical protein
MTTDLAKAHCVAEKCQCNPGVMRAFCPHWHITERAKDENDYAQIANFGMLSPEQRKLCTDHLAAHIPAEVQAAWREQVRRGVSIGCTDVRFHLGVGMAVRNCLREVLTDDKLPHSHWDDYYQGALYALCADGT